MSTRRGRTPEEERYYDLQRRVWSVLAPFYGAVVVPFRPIRRFVAHRVGARPSLRILDVATGTGEQATALARAAPRTCRQRCCAWPGASVHSRT